MSERKWLVSLAAALGVLLVAQHALAVGPGSDARRKAAGAECIGGMTPGASCGNDNDCGGLAQCALVDIVGLGVRALVTFIADKDTGGPGPFGPPTPVVIEDPGVGTLVQVPVSYANSTLTIVIEFTKDGQDYVLADSYRDVNFPLWLVPGAEWIMARGDLDIRWASGGDDLAAKLAEALGAPPGSTPYIQTFKDVPLPASADQAEADQVLASVRRYKVTIGVVPPPP
jgi:hypothetical protein